MSMTYHRAAASYEASQEFLGVLMALEDCACYSVPYGFNLDKYFRLMLSRVLSENIVHSILNDPSLAGFNCSNRYVVKWYRAKCRGRIDNYPLLVTPLVSYSPGFFASLCH